MIELLPQLADDPAAAPPYKPDGNPPRLLSVHHLTSRRFQPSGGRTIASITRSQGNSLDVGQSQLPTTAINASSEELFNDPASKDGLLKDALDVFRFDTSIPDAHPGHL